MKFRVKILLINLVLLAAAFAISGTLLMNQSYQSRLNWEVTVAMDENQMIQASIESEVINRILRDEFSGTPEDWAAINQMADTVQAHMRELEVASQLGKGTVMRVYFQRVTDDEEA